MTTKEVTVSIPQEDPEISVTIPKQSGESGENGATFIPSVSSDGVLSWTNDRDLPNPEPVSIKGKDGYTPVKGKDYFDGAPGAPGVSATHKWNGTVLSITSASGTSSADLKGEKGDPGKTPVKGVDYFDGQPGKDGNSVTVKNISESAEDGGSNVVTFSDGKKVTIKNGNKGEPGENGYTPIKNKDYFTEADKAEMVSAVIAALPKYNGEVVSE